MPDHFGLVPTGKIAKDRSYKSHSDRIDNTIARIEEDLGKHFLEMTDSMLQLNFTHGLEDHQIEMLKKALKIGGYRCELLDYKRTPPYMLVNNHSSQIKKV